MPLATEPPPSALDELGPPLHRLDLRLRAFLHAAGEGRSGGSGLPGLFVAGEEAAALLRRPAGEPVPDEDGALPLWDGRGAGGRLAWLAGAFALSPLEVDLVLVALAPEVDLRYERVFGFLQDDLSRRRPSLGLALSLLCTGPGERLSGQGLLSPGAPLVRERLLHLDPEPGAPHPPLAAHQLRPDPQLVRLLLATPGVDARLAGFATLEAPEAAGEPAGVEGATRAALAALAAEAWGERRPLRLLLHGPRGAPFRRTAALVAGAAGAPLLAADLSRAEDPAAALPVLFREAWFRDAVLFLDGVEELRRAEDRRAFRLLLEGLAADGGLAVCADRVSWTGEHTGGVRLPDALVAVPLGLAEPSLARVCWERALAAAGVAAAPDTVEALADRFRLGTDEIESAVGAAAAAARWRSATVGAGPLAPDATDLFAAARAQAARDLGSMAPRLEPRYGWDDLVLPADQAEQLREVCDQAVHRHRVYGEWGFGAKHSFGKGLNVLFSGPPGTGKTMAAEVIARTLGLDLYRIDLSQVVSKYIGETEKNLGAIFDRAASTSAVLFFDEADALFGRRSEVKDAHDRYANIETGYLLQKVEEYEGIAILATNLRQNVDEAFLRRLHAVVEFPFPDEEHRRRIWQRAFPGAAPLDPAVDFALLARDLALAGGSIRNIAVAAAFAAAANGGTIRLPHLAHAARREMQKMGRSWNPPRWAAGGEEGRR